MTDLELAAFVADVRAQANAALARLDTVDPDALPPDLRAEYDTVRAAWIALLAMSDEDAIKLHLAAAGHAGRGLTDAEAKGLAGKQ